MATKKKQPRKRGGNARALPPLPPGLGDTTETELRIAPLMEAFIGALGAAFATRAYRRLTEPRLVVFLTGRGNLHVTDRTRRTQTEDPVLLARPLCSPDLEYVAVKAWPVTQLKETHDALAAGAHWCRRCEELAEAGGGIIGPTVKHEPPAEAPIGPERAQKLMDDLDATPARPPNPMEKPDGAEFDVTEAVIEKVELKLGRTALCSRCGTAPRVYRRYGLYRVKCPTCRYTTLRFDSVATPVGGWNRSNPAPKPTVSAAAMEAADALSRELRLRSNDLVVRQAAAHPTVKPGQVYEDLRTGIRVVVGAENSGSWNMTYLDDAGGYTIPSTDLLDQTKFRRLFKFAHLWQHEPDTTDRRVSHDCDDCSFVGTRNGEPACNLSDRPLPYDDAVPDWCRLRQGPVLVTLGEKK